MGDWLARRRAAPGARARMYCFPHGGGSPGEYLRWSEDLPELEVWGVQAPGRGPRFGEEPFDRLAPMVDALVRETSFAPPFVLFGHSLGALAAYETARALRRAGRPAPVLLVVSAYPAPHLPRAAAPVHGLPDEALLAAVEDRYGRWPEEIREDPDLLALTLAVHRADFALLETYAHVPDEPLSVPVLAVTGAQDAGTPAELDGWRDHATRCDTRVVPGGHFYHRDGKDALFALIRERLDELLP
ncbi:thioesterase [Actinorhabdospora filicis]|uniref:Thioesterase n=1 Tax=Actinorhabdospora filicis TaxID=1785913 RepID=A0A9W6W149_9ACTN|nr:alpha/beta fold hydrolase [Actinorhabdospora filicis]GLZ75502.1 thioesterase [Actinorhabdospora filicis]